jgi:hypothetical protein
LIEVQRDQSFCRCLEEAASTAAGASDEDRVYTLCLELCAQGARACPDHAGARGLPRLNENTAHSTLKPSRVFLMTKLALASGEIDVLLSARVAASLFVSGGAAGDISGASTGASAGGGAAAGAGTNAATRSSAAADDAAADDAAAGGAAAASAAATSAAAIARAAAGSAHGSADARTPVRLLLGGLVGHGAPSALSPLAAAAALSPASSAASSAAPSSAIAEKLQFKLATKLATKLTDKLDATYALPAQLMHLPASQAVHVAELARAASMPTDLPSAFATKESALFTPSAAALSAALSDTKAYVTGLAFDPFRCGLQAVFDVPAIGVSEQQPRGLLGSGDTAPGAAATWDLPRIRQYLNEGLTGSRVQEWAARHHAVRRDFLPGDPSGGDIGTWFPVQVARALATRFIAIIDAVEDSIVTAPAALSVASSARGISATVLVSQRCRDWLLGNINTAITHGYAQVRIDPRGFHFGNSSSATGGSRADDSIHDSAGSHVGKRKLAALDGFATSAVAQAGPSPAKRAHVGGEAASASRSFVHVPDPAPDFAPVARGPAGAGHRLVASARFLAQQHPHLRLQFVAPSGPAKMGTSSATGLDMWPQHQAIDYSSICILHLTARRDGRGHSTYDCTHFASLYHGLKDASSLPLPAGFEPAKLQPPAAAPPS